LRETLLRKTHRSQEYKNGKVETGMEGCFHN
jgi:hypothetical protein